MSYWPKWHHMNQKLTLSLVGLTLAVVATLAIAPIVNEMAYAVERAGGGLSLTHNYKILKKRIIYHRQYMCKIFDGLDSDTCPSSFPCGS